MGSKNLSSKKKSLSSSSSHKKNKISKKSSEVRKKKRSRSRKRDKSRKLRRSDIPVHDLRNEDSVSVSSSDSEDDYRRRKGRSRTRGNIKGSKKRVRKSSSSGDDSSQSPVRKNKRGLKRTDVSKARRKSRIEKPRKKDSRRDVSVDSGSRSCSTCRGGSSSDASEVERSRGKSKGREKGKRSVDKTSDVNDRYSYRSRSLSSSSVGSEGNHYLSVDRLVSKNNSRRLKSVLAVPNEFEKGRYQNTAEDKPEIIQAYDDCPSCKSNDSYDAGRKKESSRQEEDVSEKKKQVHDGIIDDRWRSENSHQLHILPENKRQIDNGNPEDVLTSKTKTTEFTQSSKGDTVAECGQLDRTTDTEPTRVATKDEVSNGIVSSEVGDLESILRQKALENLIKFRGERLAISASGSQKAGNVVGVKQSSTAKDESESVKEADRRVFGAKETVSPAIKNINTSVVEGDPMTNSLKHGIQFPDDNSKQVKSCDTMRAAHPSLSRGTFTSNDKSVDTKGPHKKNINFGAVRKSSKGNLIYIRESSGNNLIKQAPKSHDLSDGKSEEPKKIINHNFPESPKAAPGSSNTREDSIAPQPAASEVASGITPATGDQSLTEPGNAVRGGSEFEQKTMSVMRGGEMVQVSYKVYIPKKTPALARRQLKR